MKKFVLLFLAVIMIITLAYLIFNDDTEYTIPENTDTYTEPDIEPDDIDSSDLQIPDEIAGGSCGDTITWTVLSDGTLVISGTGDIPDFEKGAGNQPWLGYWETITSLVVEDGITRIGDRAFQGCINIDNAIFGKDVLSIGEWAFQNCTKLIYTGFSSEPSLETGAFSNTPVEWDVSAIGASVYNGSSYYSSLSQVTLTGNYREDIINIALSQVGYHEGDSETDHAGDNPYGTNNYTEYGRRLGSDGTHWCSEFASWCIRTAGVPTDIIESARSANVVSFTQNSSAIWYNWHDTVYSYGNYTPQKGDILLWSWESGSYSTEDNLSHTSILWEVENLEDGTVILKTIDGNSNDRVEICSYRIDAENGTLTDKNGMLCYIIAPEY